MKRGKLVCWIVCASLIDIFSTKKKLKKKFILKVLNRQTVKINITRSFVYWNVSIGMKESKIKMNFD